MKKLNENPKSIILIIVSLIIYSLFALLAWRLIDHYVEVMYEETSANNPVELVMLLLDEAIYALPVIIIPLTILYIMAYFTKKVIITMLKKIL